MRKAELLTAEGGMAGLAWALRGAEGDGEGLAFTKARLRAMLEVTREAANSAANRGEFRFLRHLAFAWLDAPDRAARTLARAAIAGRVGTALRPLGPGAAGPAPERAEQMQDGRAA